MTIETITKTLNYVTEISTGSAAAPLPEREIPLAGATERERFEDLAGKLLQVPKSEADALRD